MRRILIAFCLLATMQGKAQELFVFSEPASNMPARSMAVKYGGKLVESKHTNRKETRHNTELQLGFNKNLMVHASTGFSDMYSTNMRWESARLYAKYRFFSADAVHKHFRMAAFVEGSKSRNELHYDELSLEGDQSGVQTGVIFTQLWHKLAVSSTIGYLKVLKNDSKTSPQLYPLQAANYSLSAGYLLFPRTYKSYRQTNFNIYAELLGQQTLDKRRFFVDFAPAIQFIFNSTTKLNAGHRFQLNGNMNRMANQSWMLSVEHTFLNALKKKKNTAL